MESEPKLSVIEGGKSDCEQAEVLKVKLTEKLLQVCVVADEAQAAGFGIAFQLGKDFQNRNVISILKLIKEF
jgi:hypothetical protein